MAGWSARYVAAGPCEARDKSGDQRIAHDRHDDRDGGGRLPRGPYRLLSPGHDYIDLKGDKFGGQRGRRSGLPFGRAEFDGNGFAIYDSGVRGPMRGIAVAGCDVATSGTIRPVPSRS